MRPRVHAAADGVSACGAPLEPIPDGGDAELCPECLRLADGPEWRLATEQLEEQGDGWTLDVPAHPMTHEQGSLL